MDINLTQLQEGWVISINYIVIACLIIYSIDLIFWYIKKILKWRKR